LNCARPWRRDLGASLQRKPHSSNNLQEAISSVKLSLKLGLSLSRTVGAPSASNSLPTDAPAARRLTARRNFMDDV